MSQTSGVMLPCVLIYIKHREPHNELVQLLPLYALFHMTFWQMQSTQVGVIYVAKFSQQWGVIHVTKFSQQWGVIHVTKFSQQWRVIHVTKFSQRWLFVHYQKVGKQSKIDFLFKIPSYGGGGGYYTIGQCPLW